MPVSIDIHSKIPAAASIQQPARVSISGISKQAPKDAFIASYDVIRETLLQDLENNTEIDQHRKRYLKQCMDANCLGGKYNRGICVVEVAAACSKLNNSHKSEQEQDEIVFAACVLGWCIEFLQAHFLVEDDIMDGSLTRRGKPCWYKMKGVSTAVAINDGLVILAWCTRMIEILLWWHPNKAVFFSAIHKTDFLTTIGQLYDTTSVYDSAKLIPDQECPNTTDFKEFTLHTYNRIVKYKTAFYTYHCPMILGLSVTNQLESVNAALVEKLAVTMGEYFQVQDDFLDCFGDPAHIGKIGTDIEDNKCSWLACTFLATHKDEQDIATFKANYGQHDAAKVKLIKDLYRKAKLEATFAKYEEDIVVSVNQMLATIKNQNAGFCDGVTQLWGRTYKRTK
jgi:farnesyl diphosphate synthase